MLLEQFVDRLGRVGFVDLLAKLSLHMEPANLGQCLDVVAHLIGPARQEDNQADGSWAHLHMPQGQEGRKSQFPSRTETRHCNRAQTKDEPGKAEERQLLKATT